MDRSLRNCLIASLYKLTWSSNFVYFREMPCFRIFTNVSSEKITDELILKASKFFTDSIKKPEQWITIHFLGDQKMSFAGSVEPCAQIYVMSIGNLGVDENQRISAEVSTNKSSCLNFCNNFMMFILFSDRRFYSRKPRHREKSSLH